MMAKSFPTLLDDLKPYREEFSNDAMKALVAVATVMQDRADIMEFFEDDQVSARLKTQTKSRKKNKRRKGTDTTRQGLPSSG